MPTIKKLDQHLANQIAAGEVVERPASVVKELIENSIDAGASKIQLEIEQGGIDLIRIRDNGCGIAADELSLALNRHATSKIQDFEDLEAVSSLGFRGEALASIAAVSRIKLISATPEGDSGFMIQAEASNILQTCQPSPHPTGTTIEVRNLFYNTPARRKFLRTPRTEYQHIETILLRLALSRFDIAFSFKHNGKVVFDLPVADDLALKEQRLAKLLGDEFLQHAVQINFEASGMTLSGWIGLPTFNRGLPDQQFFYINHRFVRDKLLGQAARQAYRDVMFHGRHAVYILSLTIDPTVVDVNVHPTKHEVRFRDGRSVFDFVQKGVRDALAQVTPNTIVTKAEENRAHTHISSPSYSKAASQRPSLVEQEAMTLLMSEPKATYQVKPEISHEIAVETIENEPNLDYPLGHAIAQLKDIYILAQNKNGLVMVDMHAAHERILYEKLKKQLAQSMLATQQLLLPITLSLSSAELNAWQELQPMLQQLAIETEQVSPNAIAIRSKPQLLLKANMDELLKDLIAEHLAHGSSEKIETKIDHILATMACRSAVWAHHKMSLIEMNDLLRQMEKTPHSNQCNHGRPSWVQLSWNELDSFFLRGQ